MSNVYSHELSYCIYICRYRLHLTNMPSNWYFASLGVYYLPKWLHTTADLDIAILQTVKVAAEAIAHCLYFGIAIWFIMQTLIFLKNLAVFFTNWLGYVFNFQPKLNFSNNGQKFQPSTRARFFSTDWNSPCLLKVLHVFL